MSRIEKRTKEPMDDFEQRQLARMACTRDLNGLARYFGRSISVIRSTLEALGIDKEKPYKYQTVKVGSRPVKLNFKQFGYGRVTGLNETYGRPVKQVVTE